MMLARGNRVKVAQAVSSHPLSSKKLLWEQPLDHRGGCIAEMSYATASSPSQQYVCIVMDHYLNSDPHGLELDFAAEFRIQGDGRNIFMIPVNDIFAGEVTVEKDDSFDHMTANSKAVVLCGYKDCACRMVPRYEAFHTCRKPDHFVCCHHCVVVEPTNSETTAKYRDFLSIASEYCSSKSIPISFMQARALFAFPHWQRARLPHSQAKVLDDYFGTAEFKCMVCESESSTSSDPLADARKVSYSFGDLSSQLPLVHADIAFIHTSSVPSPVVSSANSPASSSSVGAQQALLNPFDDIIANHAMPSNHSAKSASNPSRTPNSPGYHIESSPRTTAAIAVDTGAVRTPTLEAPLSSEEIIEALIALRKAVLVFGYTYDDTMSALKRFGAAKLLKTNSVDAVKKVIVDALQSSGITPGSRGIDAHSLEGSQSNSTLSVNTKSTASTTASLSPSHRTQQSPSANAVNPFDAAILRSQPKSSPSPLTTAQSSSSGAPAVNLTVGQNDSQSAARRNLPVPVLSLGLLGKTESEPISRPTVPSLSLAAVRSESPDSNHRPMAPTVGPALTTGPSLEATVTDADGTQKSLSRTTSKKNKLNTAENDPGSNPLLSYRSGSSSARRGKDDGEDAELSLAASQASLSTANSGISISATPVSGRSSKDRADLFQKDSCSADASTNSGASSLTISAATSAVPSRGSSMANNSFSNLLKRNPLDDQDAQQHLYNALQAHAISSEMMPSGVAALSRTNSRSNSVAEAMLMKSSSYDNDDLAILRRTNSGTEREDLHSLSLAVPITPSRSFEIEPLTVNGESDAVRGSRLQSPSPIISHFAPPSRKPSINSTGSVHLPPPPSALARTSSKDFDKHGRSTPTTIGSSSGSNSTVPYVSRVGVFSVDSAEDILRSGPPTGNTILSSLSTDERSSAVPDSVTIVRSVDQYMNDSFWKDIEKPTIEEPMRTIGDMNNAAALPHVSTLNSNTSVLARNLAVATKTMSEMDALLDETPVEVIATMKMSGKPPLRRSTEPVAETHGVIDATPEHSRSIGRRSREGSEDLRADSPSVGISGGISSSSGDSDEPNAAHFKTPVSRASPHHHNHHHNHHRIAPTTPLVNLADYPAIKRKLEEMAFDLEQEGYTREEINYAVSTQTLTNLKEIQDIDFFRLLLDSVRAAGGSQGGRDATERDGNGLTSNKGTKTSPGQAIRRAANPESHAGPVRLLRDVRIKVSFPEKSLRSNLMLMKGTLFTDVLTTIMADVTAKIASPVLMLVDESGYSREIPRECRYTTDVAFSLFDVSDGDLIELRELATASVGPRYRLCHIADADRHNESLRQKVKTLAKDYAGYRKIRGDGNCYYRAVVYGAFEQIINDGNRQAFRYMYETFKTVLFSNREHNADHNEFLAALAAASDGTCWLTVEELESDVLNAKKKLDLAMIRACKKIVSMIVIREKDVERNGLTLRDAILPSYEDCSDITAFCREYVLKMGVCAEGAHVDLGILPSALRCESHIVILPRERNHELTILHTELPRSLSGKKVIANVHLLFRPGHYDLLYPGTDDSFQAHDGISLSSFSTDSPSGIMATPGISVQPSLSFSRESMSPSTPKPVQYATLASQLVSILGVTEDMAEKLVIKCGNIEAATDYYFANEVSLKQQQIQQQTQGGSQNHSTLAPGHSYPPQPAYGQTNQGINGFHNLPPSYPPQQQATMAAHSQKTNTQSSLPNSGSASGHHGTIPQGFPTSVGSGPRDLDDRILASAVSQYPYLSQPPLRDIIQHARQYRFPIRDIIDSIVAYQVDSLPGVIQFCTQAAARSGNSSPAVHSSEHSHIMGNAGANGTLGRADSLHRGEPSTAIGSNMAAPVGSISTTSAGISGGLGREADMTDITVHQQQHPELIDPQLYGLVHKMVVGLGYRMNDVVLAIHSARCRNVFAVLRTISCGIMRIPNDLAHLNSVIDDKEDITLVSIINMGVLNLKMDKRDTVEAVIFDFCRSKDDIEDFRSYRFVRSTKEYTAAQKPIEAHIPLEGKLRSFEYKLSGMDRGDIVRNLVRLKIGFEESEMKLPTRLLRQKFYNGVRASMDRLDYM